MTHGPKHSELEYIHLFGLLARSRPALEAAEFHAKLGRLKDLVRQFCFWGITERPPPVVL